MTGVVDQAVPKVRDFARLGNEAPVRPILVICRDLAGFARWRRHAKPMLSAVVIASDDLRVHQAALGIAGVQATVFIERIKSYYSVASEVLEILRDVNDWLGRLASPDGFSKEVLYWVQHCEGGDTTQRIQDGLLMVGSYRELIDRHRPCEILLIGGSDATWEDDLLRTCAKAIGIPVRSVGTYRSRGVLRRLWLKFRPAAKELYFSTEVVWAIATGWRDRHLRFGEELVAVQLCDSAKKHVSHTAPLLRALDKAGLRGSAVCWRAGPASRELRAIGLTALRLESWVGVHTLISSWIRAARVRRRAGIARAEFLANSINPEHKLLREVLLRSTNSFLLGEVAHRYRLHEACKRFWAANPPLAVRFWTRILPQGVIAYRALPDKCRPLAFWHPGALYQVREPYAKYDVPADLVFAVSKTHQALLQKDGFAPEQIVVAGAAWLGTVQEFKRRHSTKEDSRRKLGIGRAELCVLCDAAQILRGYMAPAEQQLIVQVLLDFARKTPSFHLIVKPHPSHKPGPLEALLSGYSTENITLVSPGVSPYHALNAADLLVTKFSALALEGMVLGVPSVGALFDGELEFACYEDAVHYVMQPEELHALVEKLHDQPIFRTSWSESMRHNSTRFLRHRYDAPVSDPHEIVAQEVARRLRTRRSEGVQCSLEIANHPPST